MNFGGFYATKDVCDSSYAEKKVHVPILVQEMRSRGNVFFALKGHRVK